MFGVSLVICVILIARKEINMNLLGVLAVVAAIGLFSITILSLLFLAAYLIVLHGEPNE